jgi:hypothetical protein
MILKSILSPSNATFVAFTGNKNLYVLDSYSRFPRWEVCQRNSNPVNPFGLDLFITRDNVLKIAFGEYTNSDRARGGKVTIYDPLKKTWADDNMIAATLDIDSRWQYKIGSAFAPMTDDDTSQWGYLMEGQFKSTFKDLTGQQVSSGERCLAIINFDYHGCRVVSCAEYMHLFWRLTLFLEKDTCLSGWIFNHRLRRGWWQYDQDHSFDLRG